MTKKKKKNGIIQYYTTDKHKVYPSLLSGYCSLILAYAIYRYIDKIVYKLIIPTYIN